MADYSDSHIFASMHDFKTNIAKYTRLLEAGRYKALMVKRYDTVVGVYMTTEGPDKWEARQRVKWGFDPDKIID